MTISFRSFYILSVLTTILGCSEFEVERSNEVVISDLEYEYNVDEFGTAFSNDIVKLGRVLFYDEILSQNGQVSCASCHKQEFSFGDDVPLSVGFLQGMTLANSPTLINSNFNDRFFWDGRTWAIQSAVVAPIFDPLEMGLSFSDLSKRINGAEYYSELISKAYGTEELTKELIAEALAQFVGSMISTNTRYDRYLSGQIEFTDSERLGSWLFETHCNSCHHVIDEFGAYYEGAERDLTDIGLVIEEPLDPNLVTTYYGVELFGRNIRIRVPSLRNLSTTGPYMHDGSLKTLEEVIEHYDSGVSIENHPDGSVDERLLDRSGMPKQLNLTDDEKKSLIDFILTLTDEEILVDKKFSDPFLNK